MIDYTLSITSGAGGFAISPQLTVVRMVDRDSSPAFLQFQRLSYDLVRKPEKGVVHYVENTIEGFRELFRTANASPFDVDQDGRTLFHVSHM